MNKRLISIHLVLVVAIVLLAVFIPSCGPITTGTIEVKATLCGDPWPTQGTEDVGYTLTGPGSPINGTTVPASHTVDPGSWSCGNVTAPAGTFLESITPPSVTVAANETKIITLNFEEEQDAWIDLPPLPWTANEVPIQSDYYDAFPCDVIDVHFLQGVYGCQNYTVAVNETSWLMIHFIDYYDDLLGIYIEPFGPVKLHVYNDDCAVDKTAEPPALADKVSQHTSLNGEYINPDAEPIVLVQCVETWLDVETIWTLVKEVDYLKSINWFGISMPGFGEPHDCVLFELEVPWSLGLGGTYHFQLQASAALELMDDEDKDEGNNNVMTTVLDLYVDVL